VTASSQPPHPPANNSPRGLSGWTILIVLLLAALVIFLLFPFESVAVAAWVPALQAQLRALLNQGAPTLIVAFLGAVVGLAEISATFPNYPREALRTRWAQILVLVNVLAAVAALWLVRTYAPTMDVIVTILGVGVGFQAIIRTRFVLAKQIGGNGGSDISLNLGWLYDQFQNLCKTQMDMELMRGRRTAVTELVNRFGTLRELYRVAQYTIIARATLSPDEEKARLAELDKLFDPKAPDDFARASMALMILENGGQAYVDLLLSEAERGAPRVVTPESAAKQLAEKFVLADLVALATRLLASDDEKKWVENTAKPATGVAEAGQKAAIAHLLVQRAGVEVIMREV
jgi:hypothetical protein